MTLTCLFMNDQLCDWCRDLFTKHLKYFVGKPWAAVYNTINIYLYNRTTILQNADF